MEQNPCDEPHTPSAPHLSDAEPVFSDQLESNLSTDQHQDASVFNYETGLSICVFKKRIRKLNRHQ